jgi:hypothetical protein
MSRRDYIRFAEMVRDAGYLTADARGRLISDLLEIFKADNPRFDSDRFRSACYTGVTLGAPEPESLRADLSERDRLEARGYRDGHAAATWFAPQDEEAARRILRGLDEGDPEFLDELPAARLGGEWADEPTWQNILDDEGIEHADDGRPELLNAYTYAYSCAVERELVRSCRHLLGLFPSELRR